jgi:alpha-methylacyl-CoA racemase
MQTLDGIRVLSLATNLPGPLAVARLRSMGATVHKVEPPTGDLLEEARPEWYRELHEGIEVRRMDLKDPAARIALDALLEETDLLITATRPASLQRLGLSWEQVHARFPRLSQVAIVGNPAPEEDLPGHDLLYQAEQGLVQPPHMPRACLADFGGAQEAVIAALQLAREREKGAGGQRVVVSLSAAAGWFAAPFRQGLTATGGHLGGGFGGYHLYETRRGWVAVAALERHFQKALATALGVSRLDADQMRAVFSTKSADEWVALARAHDLPLVKVSE